VIKKAAGDEAPGTEEPDERIRELEHELAATREHLQTYIEEIETSNEELHSTNEELQSANEELETTNEELQSTNEEVRIAYTELKSAHEELEVKEALLNQKEQNQKALLNNTLQAFFLVDQSYKIIAYNHSAEQLMKDLGSGRLKKGDSIVDITSSHNLGDLVDDIKEAFDGETISGERKERTQDGADRWFEYNITPVFNEHQEVDVISIGMIDITAEKEFSVKLNSAERLLFSVFDAATSGICITDKTGRFVDVNSEYCRIYGYEREELIGRNITTMVPPEQRKSVQKLHDDFIAGKDEPDAEWAALKKDGSQINIFASARLLEYENGSRFKVTSINDLTENKKYRDLLHETQTTVSIGGWELDTINHSFSWTEEVYNIFELPADTEVDFERMLKQFPREAGVALNEAFNESLENGSPFDIELECITSSDEKKWVRITSNPVRVHKKTVKVYGTIQDISARIDTERSLRLTLNMLHERNKEQACLYNISKLNEVNLSLDELIEKSLEILPQGFKCPEKTFAAILFDGKIHESDGFTDAGVKLTAESKRGHGKTLTLEVVIPNEQNKNSRLFKEKEQVLLDTVADLLSLKFYQKEARIELEESNERLKYVIKATEDVIYDHDLTEDHIKVRESFEKKFGHEIPGETFSTETWSELVHPDDRSACEMEFENAVKDPSIHKWDSEYRFLKKDGSYANVFENGYILRDHKGKAIRVIGAIRDITERKNQEIKQVLITNISRIFNESVGVRESLESLLFEIKLLGNFQLAEVWLTSYDEKFIHLAAALDQGIAPFYDMDEQILTFKSGEGLPGITLKSGKAQFWKNIDERKSFIRRRAAKKAGFKTAYGIPVRHDNEVMGVLLLGGAEDLKKPHYFKPILEDIGDFLGEEIHRKRLEEELTRIFSAAPDIICVADFNGNYRKVNPAMSELLEYSEKELLSTNIVDFVHPDDKEKTREELKALRRGEGKNYFENRYMTRSGKIIWLAWNTRIFLDEGITYSVAKDITEQKVLENLLDQANRLAKIGSWEVDLIKNSMYWSGITREIHEVDPDFQPELESGIHFYKEGKSREKISEAVKNAIERGEGWDEELQIITAKGNERWVRAIGEAERSGGKSIRLYGSFQDIDHRKSSEIALQKLFDEKNKILESIGDAFFTVNRDWTVTYWNHMAEVVLGMPREKIVGKNLWDLYEDATSLDFYTQYHKAVSEQVTVHFEEYYPSLGIWFEVSAYPSSTGLSVYFKDISERKRNQKKILEKTQQLDAIALFIGLIIKKDDWLEALDECLGVFGEVIDADRVYYFENDLSGQPGEETTSIKIEWVREGIKPEIENPMHDKIQFNDIRSFIDPLSEKKPFNKIVKEITDKDFQQLLMGQEILSLLALPVFTDKKFRGFIGFDDCSKERVWSDEEISFLQTISINLASAIENEDAEIALQHAFDEKNTILESIGDGFFTVDNNFTVSYWNSQAEELLFTPKEKVIGKHLWDIFDQEKATTSYQKYRRALNEHISLKFEDYYDPIQKWFDVNVYPSENGISVFFKDITKRKQDEEQLKELNRTLEQQARELAASNEELEQFAFVASHDLQEPLRMISSFLAQLERKYDSVLDEKGRKYIHFATDGARRMRQIILDLLDFSRVGRIDLERKETDVGKIVESVVLLHQKMIQEKKGVVEYSGLPVIFAAEIPLQQLFQNLVNNALKYHEGNKPPRVVISSAESEKYWAFSVEDNGIGIHEEYQEKIFTIFQRLHHKDEYSGTGVGLAICKKIAEQHGGEIWVESEPGEGSTFYFTISK
jgi:PAS domain S-box-containing protein